jgi:hypothetical protein
VIKGLWQAPGNLPATISAHTCNPQRTTTLCLALGSTSAQSLRTLPAYATSTKLPTTSPETSTPSCSSQVARMNSIPSSSSSDLIGNPTGILFPSNFVPETVSHFLKRLKSTFVRHQVTPNLRPYPKNGNCFMTSDIPRISSSSHPRKTFYTASWNKKNTSDESYYTLLTMKPIVSSLPLTPTRQSAK